jgi:biotin transporter BioY
MNSVQMHLALTHVPVILSVVGLVMLMMALLKKSVSLTKTSYVVILIAGVAAVPVFLSGEGTEEAVEQLPGVSKAVIERHEEMARLAMISIAAAGLLALAALFSFRWIFAARVLKVVVLLAAITSGGLMAQTAHLGGQIRHTEIRNEVALQNGNKASGENATPGSNNQQQGQDDD